MLSKPEPRNDPLSYIGGHDLNHLEDAGAAAI